jgi:hypothetical protein
MSEPTQDCLDEVVGSLMLMANATGWQHFEPSGLSLENNEISEALRDLLQTRESLFSLFLKMHDRQLLHLLPANFQEWPLREKIFELIMIRLDLLKPYKNLVKEIFESWSLLPEKIMILRHIAELIEHNVLSCHESFPRKQTLSRIATLLYVMVVQHWIHDQSADGDATMAYLDQILAQSEDWGELLGLI